MTGTGVTWLTQEAHDRLKHELDELVAHRPVIAAEINARREEDQAITRATSRPSRKGGSATCRSCCATPRSGSRRRTTGWSSRAWS